MDTGVTIQGAGSAVQVWTLIFIGAAMVLEGFAPRRKLSGNLAWRWVNNFAFSVVSWLMLTLATAAVVYLLARWAELNRFGLFQYFEVPHWVAFLVFLLLSQATTYVVHIAFHKVPWLWRFHVVHHCDTDLDVSTSFRNHPMEGMLSLPLVAPMVMLLGMPPEPALTVNLFVAAVTVFSHSNIYLPAWLDRYLRLVVVTPDFHRLHHCSDRRYTDSNYSPALPWFDYLFGTASKRPFKQQETMSLGLEYLRDPADSRLDRLLVLPFVFRRRSRGQQQE